MPLSFSLGLNCLPMLLGATLLPVADILSSETSEGVALVSIIGRNWLLLIIVISNVMRE